jgi:hypothetical protein
METTTDHTPDDARFTQEITRLAEAIRELAHRPGRRDGGDDSEQDRLIQRVDFGYRALGTLMGRAGRGFDVPVFGARWYPRYRVIVLLGLPGEVDFIQLQNGAKDETLEVRRRHDSHDSHDSHDDHDSHDSHDDHDSHDSHDEHEQDATESRGGGFPPWISPETFTPDDAISSVLGLRHRRGPVIALGPRIAPVPNYA